MHAASSSATGGRAHTALVRFSATFLTFFAFAIARTGCTRHTLLKKREGAP